MSANRPLLADRRGTVTPRRGDPTVRSVRIKAIDHSFQVGASIETCPVTMDNTAMVPTTREGSPSPDRLVAALAVMIQQAHRNYPGGPATLPSPLHQRSA